LELAKKQFALMYNRKGMQLVDLKNRRVADIAVMEDTWRELDGPEDDVAAYHCGYNYGSYGGYRFCCVGGEHGWHHGNNRKRARKKVVAVRRNPYSRRKNPKKWSLWQRQYA
jgi:hypothetical protein